MVGMVTLHFATTISSIVQQLTRRVSGGVLVDSIARESLLNCLVLQTFHDGFEDALLKNLVIEGTFEGNALPSNTKATSLSSSQPKGEPLVRENSLAHRVVTLDAGVDVHF
jgi:hypothetical protein